MFSQLGTRQIWCHFFWGGCSGKCFEMWTEITSRYCAVIYMTSLADRISLSLPRLLELQNKFVNWTQAASVGWYATAPRDCHSTFSVCNSPRLHSNGSLSLSPTPIAIPGLYGPLFPVASLPNETVSHRLQSSKYPPLPKATVEIL